jgi:hypothetical protein
MKTDIDKKIVFDYFAGKLTPLQRKKLKTGYKTLKTKSFFTYTLKNGKIKILSMSQTVA